MPILAKYATTCAVCGGSVRPGEPIASRTTGSGEGWGHAQCPAGAVAVAPVAVAFVAGQESFDMGDVTPSRTPAPSRTPVPSRATAPRARWEQPSPPAGATEVWTDGACSGNPGPGGWAWATRDGREGYGSSPATTNQRMEVQAALEAIRSLDGPLVVVSDSTYVVNCFKDRWWQGWLSRGWVNTAKKPVANRDLWEPLIDLYVARGEVTFRWVKGHSGDVMNDRVDLLAVRAGKEQSAT